MTSDVDLWEQELAGVEDAVLRVRAWPWWALHIGLVVAGIAAGIGAGLWLL